MEVQLPAGRNICFMVPYAMMYVCVCLSGGIIIIIIIIVIISFHITVPEAK